MLKKKLFFLLVGFIVVLYSPKYGYAQNDVDRQTVFNDLTDYIATVGKEDKKKRNIVRERKIARKNARLQKNREKYFKRLKKKNLKQNKKLLDDLRRKQESRWENKR